MALCSIIMEVLNKPTIWGVLSELMMLMTPLWIAVTTGVLVGWAWKPNWANNLRLDKIDSSSGNTSVVVSKESCLGSIASLNFFKFQLPWCSTDATNKDSLPVSPPSDCSSASSSDSSQLEKQNPNKVTEEEDLKHLYKLVEGTDGGPAWIHMMDRGTSNMCYQAWRRDPETGPPQYRSRTVYEDASPEMVRDFFWDDEFRMKWDDMILHASTLEECPKTGTMVVHWVRKFPFFCSDREYIIGRRIWESGKLYYCVTKGVPNSSVTRRDKPRRVDLYYSSWCIRAVESRKGDGQMTACEVLLFHHEDMGIPWEIAKLGVRQGMWGAVKTIERGFRSYQKERALGNPLTHCAYMAHINTKVTAEYLKALENSSSSISSDIVVCQESDEKPQGRNIPKLLVVGGAVVLACSLDRGLLTKAVIFGVARRFAKFGRRL
ncbi:hypothetical protein ACFE04_007344 [Oxalis oulophora]